MQGILFLTLATPCTRADRPVMRALSLKNALKKLPCEDMLGRRTAVIACQQESGFSGCKLRFGLHFATWRSIEQPPPSRLCIPHVLC